MKRMVSDSKSEKLEQELKDLETPGDDELKNRWRSLYGRNPPQKIHRSLLMAAIAHRIQESALGPLKSSVRRHLMQAANPATPDSHRTTRAHVLEPAPCWCVYGAGRPIRQGCSKTESSFEANDTSHFPRLHA